MDKSALYKIGYGLYVLTYNDGERDNGSIVNSVVQLTDSPERIAVCVNKANYTHRVLMQTGVMNINCLSTDAPFSLFERFGFKSGRDCAKFDGLEPLRSQNGMAYLPEHINAFISLEQESYTDLDTHGLFICRVTDAQVINTSESMTYAYYHQNVKPQPAKAKGYVCKICGYVYEGETLPEDYICPLCKHPASDFEPIV